METGARTVPGGRLLLAAAILGLLAAAPAVAQESAECLECHNDPEFTGTRDGQTVSMFVDEARLKASVHARLRCVDCHADLDGVKKYPHRTGLAPVECGECHEKEGEAHKGSLHGQALAKGDRMAPTCADCHGRHDVLPPKDPEAPTNHMRIPQLCGKCHHEGTAVSRTHDIPQERILENYSEGMHGEGLYKKGLAVTAVCTSCHTSHDIRPHTDPKSSIHHDNVVKVCTQCHAQIELVHRKVIEGKLWEKEPHKIPVCVDCHQPHKVRRVFYPAGIANKDCLTCHAKPDLAMQRDGKTVSLFVDEAAYAASTHGLRTVGCAQCHADVDPAHLRPCETVKRKVDCAACHADQMTQYQASVHGTLHATGDPDAPACLDCHDKHATKSRKWQDSPTFPRNVPALCARCHQEGRKAAVRIKGTLDIPAAYYESIHGTALTESGLLVTATCISCHTAHSELPPSDPNSTVHPSRLADTCGKCHHGVERTLMTSVHWPGNTKTERPLPTCNDCHSSHEISRTDRADFKTRIVNQCGRCHEEEAETFFDTFHGKVSRLGSERAAKCHDCHGTHGIVPPWDPKSTLSRENVVETCGKCHSGSHRRFAGYLTHATHHDRHTYPWLFWSFWAMTALLIGTLSFGLLHTVAWLVRLWLTRAEWKPHRAAAIAAAKAQGVKLYRRFDRYQRTQHLLMLVSFFTLAISGMTLKFSYAGWASVVAAILGGFDSMHMLHRVAAVLLVGVFVSHIVGVSRARRQQGRTWKQMIFGPDSLMFNRKDLDDFLSSMKWFFGLGPRPRYGRWTYWEKFDYFAVFWGVAVIGLTGTILWFPEIATYVLPGPAVNVATIIHSDEALLAVAFIFTIHFFNTHFRPDKFPMDPVIFTGRVTVEELKFERPEEYEKLVLAGKLEEHLVDPFPKPVERGLRIFGFIALGIGLILIGLIIYAMIFQYR
ncbi:MAG TPA: cytochrome c3 family protein [Planctomycetota bacterium]|nr:cytochrome c3 family protein [Planctomycetota bacterium]